MLDIRANGKIAHLVKKPRKAHTCSECNLIVEVSEPYYAITWGGSGLGSNKFPDRACVACVPESLGIERTYEEWNQLWGDLFDYCRANAEEFERTCRMRGMVLCMQKIWRRREDLRCSQLRSLKQNVP